MKKKPIFLWTYSAIALLAAILMTGSLGVEQKKNETVSQPEATQYFVVRAQGDRVVVCRNDEIEPFIELDISLQSLPEYDQQQIQKGMKLKNLTELEQFIEDFES